MNERKKEGKEKKRKVNRNAAGGDGWILLDVLLRMLDYDISRFDNERASERVTDCLLESTSSRGKGRTDCLLPTPPARARAVMPAESR